MKFKVGDKVRLRKNLEVGELYGGITLNPDMSSAYGKILTITGTSGDSCYTIDFNEYYYHGSMLEPVVSSQTKFKPGDKVKLNPEVRSFNCGQGCVDYEEVGIVNRYQLRICV